MRHRYDRPLDVSFVIGTLASLDGWELERKLDHAAQTAVEEQPN